MEHSPASGHGTDEPGNQPGNELSANAALREVLLDAGLFRRGVDERALTALLVAALQETEHPGRAALTFALGLPEHLVFVPAPRDAADVAGLDDEEVVALVEVATATSRFVFVRPRGEEKVVAEARGWDSIDQLTRYRLAQPSVPGDLRVLLLPAERAAKIRRLREAGSPEAAAAAGFGAAEWDTTPVEEIGNWRPVTWESLAEALDDAVPAAEVQLAGRTRAVLGALLVTGG